MWKKLRIWVLTGLLGVLALTVYWGFFRSPEFSSVFTFRPERFERLRVEDPALPLENLDKIRKREYTGTGRDIFSTVLPPPQRAPEEIEREARPDRFAGPAPEPELRIPFRYYGYADDPGGRPRRGFFTDGEEIWIAREGDTMLMRFRVVRLGDDSAVVEESATGRRATIPMEQPPRP